MKTAGGSVGPSPILGTGEPGSGVLHTDRPERLDEYF